jgi:hypothetical protein
MNRHFFDQTQTHEHVDLSFLARSDSADARHEIEGGEVHWFTKEELEKNEYDIVPDVLRHALVALKELAS